MIAMNAVDNCENLQAKLSTFEAIYTISAMYMYIILVQFKRTVVAVLGISCLEWKISSAVFEYSTSVNAECMLLVFRWRPDIMNREISSCKGCLATE